MNAFTQVFACALRSPPARGTPVLISHSLKFFEFRLRCLSLCQCWSNLHAEPTVRHDDRSHDEACFIRSQECCYLRDLFRLCGATDRRILPVLREKVASVRHEVIQQVCYDITSSDGIDANAVRDA